MAEKKQQVLEKLYEDIVATGETQWQVYWRRFKKHTLGKIGALALIVLYLCAILADFLSPFDMRWTDKKKSFHPPTRIHLTYKDEGKTIFRPFVYEKKIVNIAFKRYGVLPAYTIRLISMETIPGRAELRVIADQKTEASRKQAVIRGMAKHYNLPDGHDILAHLDKAINELEADKSSDIYKSMELGAVEVDGRVEDVKILLAKGNKNFLSFFSYGVPFNFLGLFKTNIHFFGSPAGGVFLLGADQFGRDVVSRLLHGSRISLSIGILGALISFTIGLILGGAAGYFGGAIDNIMMRFCEVIYSFPRIYLLFALRATFPPTLTSVQVYLLIVLIMAFVGWASLARVIRGMVLSLKSEDYILSARAMGLSSFKIIIKHVLPNTLSFVIIQATITIPAYILGESTLSLLGLGISEPQSSWGLMLAVARNHRVVKDFPWILMPGFAIFIAIMAWNFFGDGIRDAVDPRSRH